MACNGMSSSDAKIIVEDGIVTSHIHNSTLHHYYQGCTATDFSDYLIKNIHCGHLLKQKVVIGKNRNRKCTHWS